MRSGPCPRSRAVAGKADITAQAMTWAEEARARMAAVPPLAPVTVRMPCKIGGGSPTWASTRKPLPHLRFQQSALRIVFRHFGPSRGLSADSPRTLRGLGEPTTALTDTTRATPRPSEIQHGVARWRPRTVGRPIITLNDDPKTSRAVGIAPNPWAGGRLSTPPPKVSRRWKRPTLAGDSGRGGRILIGKGEPTVDEIDPFWRLKPWGSVSYR